MTSPNNRDKPLVSILICTYNRADYLDECLYSVLSQDFKNYEIVIRDNHSDDHTEAVVKKYEPLFNIGANYRYIRNATNVGFMENMRDGITKDCRGKYCVNLGDDDFFITDKILGLFVKTLESSERIAFVTSGVYDYDQNRENSLKSPKDIIKENSNREISLDRTLINGNDYFLNFWSKYPPITFSATMFRRKLAIERNWVEFDCLDQSMALLLSLNQGVVIYHDKFACYRTHSSPTHGTTPLRITGLPLELAIGSHKSINKWGDYARRHSDISRFSLFVWRLKNIILKDEGPIRWLHDQNESELKQFLGLVKKHSYLHYVVLRYLSPQIIKYDYEAVINSKHWLIRIFRKIGLQIRRRISALILRMDRVSHDPEYPVSNRGKFLRLIVGSHKHLIN